MRSELHEYYIIVRSAPGVAKAWTPVDPVTGYTYDLEKLPKRGKFGMEAKAQTFAADLKVQANAHLDRLKAIGDAHAKSMIPFYEGLEFRVAKVAITVDL